MFTNRSNPRILSVLLILFFTLALAGPVDVRQPSLAKPAREAEAPSLLQYTSGGHVLGFTSQGMYAATGSHVLRVDFVDANAVTPLSADSEGVENPNGLAGAAPPFTSITYPNLWDGVTLTYDATGIVRSTYHLEPYADPNAIRLHYNRPVLVQNDGSLQIEFETGSLTETAPIAWQEIDGQRVSVAASFKAVSETEIGFALGAYDSAHSLFIDPTLTWNTFVGSSNSEYGYGIAVDDSGNVYVAGYGNASWGTPVNAHAGSLDAFAAKFDTNGTLLWNTFMGSSMDDFGLGIAVDGSGNAYVGGYSYAGWGTPTNNHAGTVDTFAAKFDTNGTLLWNTFIGSTSYDYTTRGGIAVDSSGNVYMGGFSILVSWGTPINPHSGQYDAFAAKFDTNGTLLWNTFMGSNNLDYSNGIAVDGSGNVYVAGYSNASWGIPLTSFAGGHDSFVAKFDTNGALLWNTFMGSSGNEFAVGIAVEGSGNVYVAGHSNVSWGTPINPHAGNQDTFVAKFDTNGTLLWNTFMGSSVNDGGSGIAVDASENVYVIGYSPVTWGTPINPHSGELDTYATKLDTNGALLWNTFMGSSVSDNGNAIAVDASNNMYVVGFSYASWGTPVNPYAGDSDVFIAKLSDTTEPDVSSILRASPDPTTAASVDFTVTFSEPVIETSVDASDFAVATSSGISGAAVSGVSGSGATYTVSVSTGTGSGTIRLDLIDDDSIVDASSNPLGGVGNDDFTTGEYYTILGPVLYATQGGMTTGFCNNWANACELHYALSIAESGKQIWVKEGTYKPTGGSDRTATFTLKNGVAIYGGFIGIETLLSERNPNPATNNTSLSGDIGTVSNASDNSYHVVTGGGTNNTAILDGFTVTGGNADAGSDPYYFGGGMYNESSNPTLANITFSSNSATYRGGGMYNITSSPTLTNVTFTNNTVTYTTGNGGGMSNYSSSSPILTDVTFSGNAAAYGGGMYNYNGSNPIISNMTFSGNAAVSWGGGMLNDTNSSPSVTNVTFSNNSASAAGGMYNYNNSNPILTNVIFNNNSAPSGGGGMSNFNSSPILTDVTFSNNTSGTHGGGIANESSSPSLTDVSFVNNTAQVDGGGMFNYISSNPSLTNVTFSGNSADTHGGGMTNHTNSSPTLTDVTFTNNTATFNGGGIFNYGGSNPSLSQATFSGNSASSGGGIFDENSSPILMEVIFANNTATTDGGGIHHASGSLTVTNSTFSGNGAANGGGLRNGGSAIITNSTFYGNTASVRGGGFSSYGTATIINSTFSDNSANIAGGGVRVPPGGTITLRNTIVANSISGGDCSNEGTLTNGGNNLVEDNSCGFTGGSDPALGPLQDNGGFTQTMAPLPGSPAIDAGNNATCAATDQRGVSRPQGSQCDSGAYEYEYAPFTGIGYVKWDAAGANNGTSWADAYTDLQSALVAASPGAEIWVAEGTYYPTSGTNRFLSFNLKNGVAIYGGFDGTETLLSQRDLANNVTVLSGDIGIPGISDNSYHVVTANNTNNSAVLDGFTITYGYANGSGMHNSGGGMVNRNGSPGLENVVFTTNGALYRGGALYNSGTLTIENGHFIGNAISAGAGYGGGIYNDGSLTLNDSSVSQNSIYIGNGGGIFNDDSLILNNSVISENSARYEGGGLYNLGTAILNGSLVSRNYIQFNIEVSIGTNKGGGIANYNNLTLNNSSVIFNEVEFGIGGGVSNDAMLTLNNSTVSGNSAEINSGGISNGGTLSINFSTIVNNETSTGSTGGIGGGTITLKYSIVAANKGANGINDPNADCGGGIVSQDYNLTGSSTGCNLSGIGDVTVAPADVFMDVLDGLDDNGGATQTHALIASLSNPALNAIPSGTSDCGTTPFDQDQRGESRPFPVNGNCDIGAYESQVINSAPVITEGDSVNVTMSEDGSPTSFALILNATDTDGDTLNWSISNPAARGTASVSSTGTSKSISYTPNLDYNGSDSFEVRVDDGSLADTITVNVTINPVNDAPVITEGDSIHVTMSEDGNPVPFALTLNATDVEGQTLSWIVPPPFAPLHGVATVSGNGTSKAIQYTPDAGYFGTDSFIVSVDDGFDRDLITVNVTISQVNAPPVITEGASVDVIMSEDDSPTAFDLTLNATDPDGDPLTWSISNPAGNGTATAIGTGLSKAIDYTPIIGYSGTDSFDVQVSDGEGGTDTITVNVTIDAVNDAPIITEGATVTVTMSEDGSPTAFDLTLNATDADGDTLTWSISTPAGNGTATAIGTGLSKVIGYSPGADYNGSDSFEVQVSDPNGGMDTITVNVTIDPINDAPVITEGDSVNVTMSQNSSPVAFDLTLNATDIDNPAAALNWSISTPASNGTAVVSGTGASKVIAYTPTPGYSGTDSFDVRLDDGNLSDFITVNVTIRPMLTVSSNSQTITYGDAEPSFTPAYSGFVGGDNSAVLDTQPTCGVARPHTDAGVYTIICSGGVDDTYDFTYVDGTLTVAKALLTVTADDPSIVYGGTEPTFTLQYSGFVGSDTFADLDTEPTCGVAGAHTDVGTYAIACSGGVDNNYSFSYVDGTLTVAKATLTITAHNKDIVFGGLEPSFTFAYSGFVSGDVFAVLDTQPTCGVSGAHTDAGTYTITCSGGADNNYDFIYVNGTLTIANADQTIINVTAPATAVTGEVFGVSADATSILPVTFSASGSCTNAGATFTMTDGSGTCTVIYDQAGDSNFNPALQVTRTVLGADAPILLTPADSEVLLNNTPTFDWTDVPAAIGYTIQISTDTGFTSPTSNTVTVSTFTLAASLPSGVTRYWRVCNTTAAGPGLCSADRSFVTASPPSVPNPIDPINDVVTADLGPTLDWSTSTLSPGTSFLKYELQISADDLFTSLMSFDITGRTNSDFTPGTDLNPDTRYYWRVRAFNTLEQFSAWSVVGIFRTPLGTPVLLSPTNNSSTFDTQPVFDWSDVPGAISYTIEISTNNSFAPTSIVITANVTDSTFTPASPLPQDRYYWRVQAIGPNGPGQWSLTFRVRIR